METSSDQAADLSVRVAQWIAGGETYEVEFKGEQRERRCLRCSSGLLRVRTKNAPQNMASMRNLTIGTLRADG